MADGNGAGNESPSAAVIAHEAQLRGSESRVRGCSHEFGCHESASLGAGLCGNGRTLRCPAPYVRGCAHTWRMSRLRRVEVRMDTVDCAVLDAARGEVTRSEWIRRLIRDRAQPRVIVVEREREPEQPH